MKSKRVLLVFMVAALVFTFIIPVGISAPAKADGFTPIFVNFQRPEDPAYPGYLVDSGAAYGDRGNGFTYGWNDATYNYGKLRSHDADFRYNSLLQLGNGTIWEINIPNGSYYVRIVAGDADYPGGTFNWSAEGTTVIDGSINDNQKFLDGYKQITVYDGKLTISTPKKDSVINFLEISKDEPLGDTASYIKSDTNTKGNWKGTYGSEGYDIANLPSNLPYYTKVNYIQEGTETVSGYEKDDRALAIPNDSGRIPSIRYSPIANGATLTVNVSLDYYKSSEIALYIIDINKLGRTLTLDVINSKSGAIIDTKLISDYKNGDYLVYKVSGNITFRFTNTSQWNVLLSGIFFDPVAIPAPPDLTSLKVTKDTNSLELSLAGLQSSASGYTYQIWSYEEYGNRNSVDGSDGDSGAYWRLVKGYSGGFDGVGIGSDGTAKLSWKVNGALSDSYKIFIRIKPPAGNGGIIQSTKEFSAKDTGLVKINSILFDSQDPSSMIYKNTGDNLKIDTLAEGTGPLTYEYYFDDQLIPGASAQSVNYTIPDCTQGNHTIKVIVTNGNDTDEKSANIFVNNTTTNYIVPEIDGFNVAASATVGSNITMALSDKAGNGPNVDHRYQIGEPGRSYFSNSSLNTYTFQYPGVYQIFGNVRNTNARSFSDGAIKYITVSRKADDSKAPITLQKTNVLVKDMDNNGAAVTTDTIAAGTNLQFVANASRSDVQYSFWRLDARGYRLVQDWGSSNTLNWKPAQPGNYTISVRVRDNAYAGNKYASYEAAQSFNYNVTGCSNTSTVAIITTEGSTKRAPVKITAGATASQDVGNLLYRFEVNDSFMGTYTVQDYSLSNTCTWIPRKAGTYTIIVRVRDQGSYGYYDSYKTQSVTIN